MELANNPGNQKNIIHQYSLIFSNTSAGNVPNNARTTKPTKPEKNLIHPDQKFLQKYKTSEINHKLPLIMTHGWPGSIQEFLKIIPIIHRKSKIPIDIICPSMPGFGFSDKPTEKGMNSEKIAKIQHELMRALGYDKYVVQGGDWGATVSKWMESCYPGNGMVILLRRKGQTSKLQSDCLTCFAASCLKKKKTTNYKTDLSTQRTISISRESILRLE